MICASFITWFANKITGMHFADTGINILTLVFFMAAAILSVYFNFLNSESRPGNSSSVKKHSGSFKN